MQCAAGPGHDGRRGSSPGLSRRDVLHATADFLRPRRLDFPAGESPHALHDPLDEADARAWWQLQHLPFQCANCHKSNRAEVAASGKWGNPPTFDRLVIEAVQFAALHKNASAEVKQHPARGANGLPVSAGQTRPCRAPARPGESTSAPGDRCAGRVPPPACPCGA